jgi:hypothetical protein
MPSLHADLSVLVIGSSFRPFVLYRKLLCEFRLNFIFGNGRLLAKCSLACIVEYKAYSEERLNLFLSILTETAYNTAKLCANKVVCVLYWDM